MDPKLMGGADAIIVADVLKDEMRFLEYSAGDAIASAIRMDREQGTQKFQALRTEMSQIFGDIDRQRSIALMAPDPKRMAGKTVGWAALQLRRIAQRVGLPLPFRGVDIPGMGRAHMITGPLRVRGTHAPSYTPLRFDPFNFMGLSTVGPGSRQFAAGLHGFAQQIGGPRARNVLSFINPFLGRALPIEQGTHE
ncbi:MAG: hypothetical protein GTN93_15320, partial [Anaerolineae bacterium]|nr:hypothetical protein [Anaerolineae bacterium]